MTNAAVWQRVSTDEQDAANQLAAIGKFAAHHGYEVTRRYALSDSAWNGGKDGGEYRAAVQEMLGDAHRGEFSVLIVWALDRITREGAEGALRLIRQLRERGCVLVSVQESWLNGLQRRAGHPRGLRRMDGPAGIPAQERAGEGRRLPAVRPMASRSAASPAPLTSSRASGQATCSAGSASALRRPAERARARFP